MVSIEDIPAEKRWEIAGKSARAMLLIYDMHFWKVLERSMMRSGGNNRCTDEQVQNE